MHAGSKIESALQPFVDNHTIAGVVTLVATKDEVLSLAAVGFSDLAAKKPMRTDDLFWIASMSKPMTATALMMLVDEGKVNVDDPVEKYLPEFKGQMVAAEKGNPNSSPRAPKHPILVRNILSHTSGLPFSSPIERPTLDMNTLKMNSEHYAKLQLQSDPDSKYQYANSGINITGRIIEVVSGMSYEQFMAKRLFEPLGMKDTTFRPTEEQVARLAKSYTPNADMSALDEVPISQLHYPLTDHNRQPMPAGGLFSTAADVCKFGQMILNGGVYQGKRYLSEASITKMTTKATGDLPESYGFGWSVGTTIKDPCSHGGAYKTMFWVDRPNQQVKVLMVQSAGSVDLKDLNTTFWTMATEVGGHSLQGTTEGSNINP